MARDLIPPPSPAGRPQPEGTPRLVELPPEPPPVVEATAPSGPLPPTRVPESLRVPDGRAGRRRDRVVARAGRRALDQRRRVRRDRRRARAELVQVAADGYGDRRRRGADRREGRRRVPASRRQAARAGRAARHAAARGRRAPARPAATSSVSRATRVLYNLNGLGPSGSIKGGKPSPERLKVLHREALELALYTFRYLPDVEMASWRCCRRRPRRRRPRRRRRRRRDHRRGARGDTGSVDDAQRALLPPGRSQAAAAGPARHDAGGRGADAGHAARRRSARRSTR